MMKTTATEEVMAQRRLERLDRLNFFMKDPRAPKTGSGALYLQRMVCHTLLRGFFQNSHWRTAWWCLREAVDESWMWWRVKVDHFYWRRILRLNDAQVEERIDRMFK